MNPGPTVGLFTVVAVYGIVMTAIFIFIWSMINRQKDLEKRLRNLREDLQDTLKK